MNQPPGDFYVDVIIENYVVKGFPKGLSSNGTFKFSLHVSPDFEKYENIESWFEHYQESLKDPNEPASNPSFPDIQKSTIAEVPAVRWSGIDYGRFIAYAFGKDKWLYTIVVFSENTENENIADEISSSFSLH